jgi:dTDP-L-rhamnose 4-epimerase
LVTGGAGLIGSHVADRLLRDGWAVRILDNLEPQTHRNGKPAWVPREAEFVYGDLRDRTVTAAALDGADVVFHQAAYGGFMPEIAKYVEVNAAGTAQMLELIRDRALPIRKVIVASSQVVYPEGAATCDRHGLVFPSGRPLAQLRRGDFSVHCPRCGGPTHPVPTPEEVRWIRSEIDPRGRRDIVSLVPLTFAALDRPTPGQNP